MTSERAANTRETQAEHWLLTSVTRLTQNRHSSGQLKSQRGHVAFLTARDDEI